MKTIVSTLLVGVVTRLGLMLYGLWQDSVMAVKYTDVDYYVFTDAAKFMVKGESPYRRATYRYTPLLAWILQPNVWWSPIYGKILFILCDVFAGYLIYCILKKNHDVNTARLCAQTWLLNPLPIVVSSRGNAESVLVVLVLATLFLFTKPQTVWNITICSIFYGLSVHMKMYPITYVVPMYLLLVNMKNTSNSRGKLQQLIGCNVLPNWRGLLFILVTGCVILMLTVICYHWCGIEFIQETYLYHVTRRDTRHNFSPYFYMLYLIGDSQISMALGLVAFIPQYFLWYLCILPLIIPRLYISLKEACFLILLWFGGQSMWLLPAYYLEFNGQNTFILIWMAGLVFLGINVWILHRFIHSYQPIMESRTALLNIKEKCP